MEEIAPRIKRLIEAELSDDVNDELEAELGSEEWDDSEMPDLDADDPSEIIDDLAVPDLSDALPSDDLDSEESFEDDAPISVGGMDQTIEAEDGQKVTVNITVEGERRRKARRLYENLSGPRTSYQLALKKFKYLRNTLNETKNRKKRTKILREMVKLQKTIIFNNND